LNAGQSGQAANAVAIGLNAGLSGQSIHGVAIGANAGAIKQGISAIAIGQSAGNSGQGDLAIAIGFEAGKLNQHSNTIILNALGGPLNSDTTNATFVRPIRRDDSIDGNFLKYDTTTNEVVWSATITYAAFRLSGSIQSPASGVDRAVLFDITDSNSTPLTLTGNGVFTNAGSYNVTVQVSYMIGFPVSSVGIRAAWVQLEGDLGDGRFATSVVNANSVSTEPTILTGTTVIPVPIGSTFRIFVFQTSGNTMFLGSAVPGINKGYACKVQILCFR
jgi:hypothetical protein